MHRLKMTKKTVDPTSALLLQVEGDLCTECERASHSASTHPPASLPTTDCRLLLLPLQGLELRYPPHLNELPSTNRPISLAATINSLLPDLARTARRPAVLLPTACPWLPVRDSRPRVLLAVAMAGQRLATILQRPPRADHFLRPFRQATLRAAITTTCRRCHPMRRPLILTITTTTMQASTLRPPVLLLALAHQPSRNRALMPTYHSSPRATIALVPQKAALLVLLPRRESRLPRRVPRPLGLLELEAVAALAKAQVPLQLAASQRV